MSRRFQFSLLELIRAGVFSAVACGLFRLAYNADAGWRTPTLLTLASTAAGAALGSLMHRPYIGAAIGFFLMATFAIVALAVFFIRGGG